MVNLFCVAYITLQCNDYIRLGCLLLREPNQWEIFVSFLKFGYSEKATKSEKIFHLKFDATQKRQIVSGRFFSNFVAFSEYPNFKRPLKSVVHSANRFVKITAPVTRLLTFNCRQHEVLSHGQAELNAHILCQKLFYPRRPSFHEINCFKFMGLFKPKKRKNLT